MQAEKLRICIRCWHREQAEAKKEHRAVRPGFRSKPSDWREPKPKKIAGRTARKNVVRD
jgi:hypothetical protein